MGHHLDRSCTPMGKGVRSALRIDVGSSPTRPFPLSRLRACQNLGGRHKVPPVPPCPRACPACLDGTARPSRARFGPEDASVFKRGALPLCRPDKSPHTVAPITVPRSARDETCGWLGTFRHLREWIGPRQVKNLTARGFTTRNRKFESTVSISRVDMADDRLGMFKPMFSEMGTIAARHLRRTGPPVRRGRTGVRAAEIGLRLALL